MSKYREAERALTKLQPLVGKPGQSSSPNGILLNEQAILTAKLLSIGGHVHESLHSHPIHTNAIVEAFPTSFLGVMLEEPQTIKFRKGRRSDAYFEHLANNGELQELLSYLLPGRFLENPLKRFSNHDDRAAVICALTALCVSSGNYSAIGDATD